MLTVIMFFFSFLLIFSVYYIKIGSFFFLNTNQILRKMQILNHSTNISKENFLLADKYYFDSQTMSNNQITNFSNGLKLWLRILYSGDFYV